MRDRLLLAFPELGQMRLMKASENPEATPSPIVVNVVVPPDANQQDVTLAEPTTRPLTAAEPIIGTPVVVFSPEGVFTPDLKAKLNERIVLPFIDYDKDHPSTSKVLTVQISQNTQASKNQYPYLFEAIYENGGTVGFVIAPQGDSFQWYVPEGMGGCQLTAAYKQKYPEIAKACGE